LYRTYQNLGPVEARLSPESCKQFLRNEARELFQVNFISFVSCRAQRPKKSRAVSKFSESASVRGKDGKLVVLAQVPLRLIADATIDCKNLRVEFVKEVGHV
jgi:hypothetical protein